VTFIEFQRLRAEGKVSAGINNTVALRLVEYLPGVQQVIVSAICLFPVLSFFGFVAVSIIYKWWVGLLLILFGTPLVSRTSKNTAVNIVLNYVVTDETAFNKLVEYDILLFQFHE